MKLQDFTTPRVVNELPVKSEFMAMYPDCWLTAKVAFKSSLRAWLRSRAGEAQNWKCCWCGIVTTDSGRRQGTLEHIIPVSMGGKDVIENVALACRKCNSMRGNTPVDEFLSGGIDTRTRKERKQSKIISRAEKLKANNWFRNGRKINPQVWLDSTDADNKTKAYIIENYSA